MVEVIIMSKRQGVKHPSSLRQVGEQINVCKFHDIWDDDFCDAIIGAMLTSFVDDYFRYLRAYRRRHKVDDLIKLNSVLYQFEHCPWLVYVEGKTPQQLVDALVKKGEELYGKEESTN